MGFDDRAHFVPDGFTPAYAIEPNPEYPGSGEWGDPLFCFDHAGALTPEPDTTWGPPIVVRVCLPTGSEDWVGMFPSAGLYGLNGFYATPSPFKLAVLSEGEAYLVDVRTPGTGAGVVQHQVIQVLAVGTDLLLLVSWINIVAIGRDGVEWKSQRLAMDDLKVKAATETTITCSGSTVAGKEAEIEVVTSTGKRITGPEIPEPLRFVAEPPPQPSGHTNRRIWKHMSGRWRHGR